MHYFILLLSFGTQALKQAGVEFSTSIRVLLDFLLALYVSIHIANWWSLRERCVGKLWSPPPFLA